MSIYLGRHLPQYNHLSRVSHLSYFNHLLRCNHVSLFNHLYRPNHLIATSASLIAAVPDGTKNA